MSRIGKLPVTVPSGVEIAVSDENVVTVKGPKGTLNEQIDPSVKVEVQEGVATISATNESKFANAQQGLVRSLINNMVIGVTEGYAKKLLIKGVGYRAEKQGDKLVMQLGFSHPIEMKDPEDITVEVNNPTELVVKGISKQNVGNYAAVIRAWRKPEPYHGKGILYEGEQIRRKVGKTGK